MAERRKWYSARKSEENRDHLGPISVSWEQESSAVVGLRGCGHPERFVAEMEWCIALVVEE